MKKIICGLTFFLIVAHALTSEQLLIHVLRQDFLKLEDELWKIILSQNSETKVDPWITVVRKFYDFDQKVKQVSIITEYKYNFSQTKFHRSLDI